jgi:hypothetical protein
MYVCVCAMVDPTGMEPCLRLKNRWVCVCVCVCVCLCVCVCMRHVFMMCCVRTLVHVYDVCMYVRMYVCM